MAKRYLLTVARVWKLIGGSNLTSSLTTSWTDGSTLAVEAVTDFSPTGGEGVFEPDTVRSEAFLYSGVNETTDVLTGVTRPNARFAHATGTLVQEGLEATVEKWADGHLDDEELTQVSIPVPPRLYPLLKLGARNPEDMEVIPVLIEDDDDDLSVADGPLGAVPLFDEDLEVVPAVGGGDASTGVPGPDNTVVLPPGMGYEDGEVPSGTVTPIVTGGIGNTLFVRIPTLSNSSQIKYKVHIHTTNDFTPAANTLYAVTSEYAGTPGFTAVIIVKDFPTGHVLDGTASDPPAAGTTYYVKVIPTDGSGEAAGPYPQASGTPVTISSAMIGTDAITATKIADDSIETPHLKANIVTTAKIDADAITANELAANSVTSAAIAAFTIVAGDIAASTITADKMSVSSLSAISANIGTITAGTITGVTITGGTLESATSGRRIRITTASADTINFLDSSGNSKGFIQLVEGSSRLLISSPGGAYEIGISGADFHVLTTSTFDSEVTISDKLIADQLVVDSTATAPPAGKCAIYYNGTDLVAKNPSGTVRALNNTAF